MRIIYPQQNDGIAVHEPSIEHQHMNLTAIVVLTWLPLSSDIVQKFIDVLIRGLQLGWADLFVG